MTKKKTSIEQRFEIELNSKDKTAEEMRLGKKKKRLRKKKLKKRKGDMSKQMSEIQVQFVFVFFFLLLVQQRRQTQKDLQVSFMDTYLNDDVRIQRSVHKNTREEEKKKDNQNLIKNIMISDF